MGKGAEAWATPLLNKWSGGERTGSLESWAALKQSFLIYFDTPIKETRALNNIYKLSQTGSAQQYATKFREYAQELQWNDTALAGVFKRGLKPEVRSELLKAEINPNTRRYQLEDWIELAIQTDDIMYAGKVDTRDREKKVTGKMATTSTTSTKPRNVSETEVDRRKAANLCIKCGKAGHFLKGCTSRIWVKPSETKPASGKQGTIVEVEESESEKE